MELHIDPRPRGTDVLDLRRLRSDALVRIETRSHFYTILVANQSHEGFLVVVQAAHYLELKQPQVGMFFGAEVPSGQMYPNQLRAGTRLHFRIRVGQETRLRRLITSPIVAGGIALLEGVDITPFVLALTHYQSQFTVSDGPVADTFLPTVENGSR